MSSQFLFLEKALGRKTKIRRARILYPEASLPPPFRSEIYYFFFFDFLMDFDGGTSFTTYGTPDTHALKPEALLQETGKRDTRRNGKSKDGLREEEE